MVQVIQHAVRVFGSAAYKDHNSQGELQTQRITLDPYPFDDVGTQGRALVYLGSPVFWVKEAGGLRRVLGHVFLGLFVGTTPTSDAEQRIAEALQAIDSSSGRIFGMSRSFWSRILRFRMKPLLAMSICGWIVIFQFMLELKSSSKWLHLILIGLLRWLRLSSYSRCF